MRHITASTAQKDFNTVVDDVTRYNEPVTIVADDSKTVVVLSIEEWRSIQETLYLTSIPRMSESIKRAASEPLDEGTDAAEADFDV